MKGFPATLDLRPWLLGLFGALAVTRMVFGPINPDEGFYLYAGWAWTRGSVPYADFAYSQWPGTAFLWSCWFSVFPAGLLTGRLLPVALTLAAAGAIARHLGSRGGMVFLGLLLGSWWLWTPLVQARTFAFANAFLVAGVLSALRGRPGLASLAGAAATLCRLSALPLAVLVTCWSILQGEDRPRGTIVSAGMWTLAGAVLAALTWGSWEPFRFHTYEFHLAREVGLTSSLLGRLSFVLHVLLRPWSFALMVTGLAAWRWRQDFTPTKVTSSIVLPLLVGLGGLVVHLPARVSGLDHSYVALSGMCLLMGLAALLRGDRPHERESFLTAMIGVGAVVAFFGVLVTSVLPAVRGQSGWQRLRRVAATIQEHVPANGRLLTPETLAALQSRRAVLPGYEGCFFYPFADTTWTEPMHVRSLEQLLDDIRHRRAAGLLLRENTFRWAYPAFRVVPDSTQARIRDTIMEHYVLAASLPDYGQWAGTLELYVPR